MSSLERSFQEIYADVPTNQRETFVYFRQTHPPKHTAVSGTSWKFIDSRQGDDTVLLLVGGLREADAAWRSIPMLEDEYRIIAPTYPAENTMADLADGLAGVLTAAGVEKAHVLAGSFGGMLAQVFIRRHPDRVKKLVLSTTAVLDEESTTRYQQALDALQKMDDAQVREMAKSTMFDIIAPPEDMQAFYRAYLDELYTERVNREELLSTYHCLLDFANNYTLSADDLKDWGGQTLILESGDDATFDAQTRERVRQMYPNAKTHIFENAGHSPAMTQRETYFQVVKDFLKG